MPTASCSTVDVPSWSMGTSNHYRRKPHHGNGTTGLALQTARIHLSIERNLRRPERFLGLRPAGRGTETQRPRGVVARHGRRPQRTRRPAGRPLALRNDRARLLDHHAPASLEMLGPLRSVPRFHDRLPRNEEPLPLRPGARPLGGISRAADFRLRRFRRQRRSSRKPSKRPSSFSISAARTPTICTGTARWSRWRP